MGKTPETSDSSWQRRAIAHKRVDSESAADAENSQPMKPGSVAFRSQTSVSRSLGSDPLVRSSIKQRSKVKPKAPKAQEPDTLRPTGWRELRGHP
jgi:hypothetical protein